MTAGRRRATARDYRRPHRAAACDGGVLGCRHQMLCRAAARSAQADDLLGCLDLYCEEIVRSPNSGRGEIMAHNLS